MSNSGELLNSMMSTVMCVCVCIYIYIYIYSSIYIFVQYIYILFNIYILFRGFSGSSVAKEYTCNAQDPGLVPGLGRSPGERIGYPL